MRIFNFNDHATINGDGTITVNEVKLATPTQAILWNSVEGKSIMSSLLSIIKVEGEGYRILKTDRIPKYISDLGKVIMPFPEYSLIEKWSMYQSLDLNHPYEGNVKIQKTLQINVDDDVFERKLKTAINGSNIEVPVSSEAYINQKLRELEKGTASYKTMREIMRILRIVISDVKLERLVSI